MSTTGGYFQNARSSHGRNKVVTSSPSLALLGPFPLSLFAYQRPVLSTMTKESLTKRIPVQVAWYLIYQPLEHVFY